MAQKYGKYRNVGFEALAAVPMKNSAFCNVRQCTELKVKWPFGRKIWFCLQGDASGKQRG
jgi:hypothetical protein